MKRVNRTSDTHVTSRSTRQRNRILWDRGTRERRNFLPTLTNDGRRRRFVVRERERLQPALSRFQIPLRSKLETSRRPDKLATSVHRYFWPLSLSLSLSRTAASKESAVKWTLRDLSLFQLRANSQLLNLLRGILTFVIYCSFFLSVQVRKSFSFLVFIV